MDSSRTRWQQSAKSSGLSSNLQPSGSKVDTLREEMEEAANRVEICRDQLSADMYNFVAKEIDYANYFQTLIEVQAEYHRKSLALLQNVLPQIKAQQEAWIEKPSFGKPLEEHLAASGREIAFPIEACVTMLLECGMQEEGLFRVAPSASKLKKLKAALDCCVVDVQEYSADPHAIAGALKSYLRELPEPLMTFELYDEWIQASNLQDQDKRLQALWNACEKLPKANHSNIRYLIKFLAKLTEYQDANKMTPSNVAIVLGPNLLWPQAEGYLIKFLAKLTEYQDANKMTPSNVAIVLDIEFNVTGNYGSPMHVNHNANYSSMPSPDMDHADRKQHDQARRPLSVATDNMMLEFYKKDGMGVRVMDTSWVARRGTTVSRKASSTPPAVQPPAPPSDLSATPQSPIPEQSLDISATPSPPPTSFGFPPAAERTSTDDVSSSWLDSCYSYPSPEDDRPPPYPCYQHLRHYPPQGRATLLVPWGPASCSTQPQGVPTALGKQQSPGGVEGCVSCAVRCMPCDPEGCSLASCFHRARPACKAARAAGVQCVASPEAASIGHQAGGGSALPARVAALHEAGVPERGRGAKGTGGLRSWGGPRSWGAQGGPCGGCKAKGLTLVPLCSCLFLRSTLKTKELSPVSGQKGSPGSGHAAPSGSIQPAASPTQQLSTEQSPHALRKVSKKLAPIPPKVPYGQSGGMSDQSTGQPSPVSLSPTPPSTPSPYGLNYPHGYSLASGQLSPAAAPSLSSPSALTSTLTKSRPTPKPRQRPTLPPPQPPTASVAGASPQSMDHTLLDDMSPGESMSTDLVRFDVPSIYIEGDAAPRRELLEQSQRHSVAGKGDSEEEESESTAL
nr:rho GTPase-activating protein 44 [Pelodiscus sinensis]|eukprot:XP_025044590.1 rho GTPase-activating protein 44 [Pelodiscus sinensis]